MTRQGFADEEDGACLHQCSLMGGNMLREPKKVGVMLEAHIESGAIRKCGFAGVGLASLKEVCHCRGGP